MTIQANIQLEKLVDALRNAYDSVYILKYVGGRFQYEYISVSENESTYLTEESIGKYVEDVIPSYRTQKITSLLMRAMDEQKAIQYTERLNAADFERMMCVPLPLQDQESTYILVYSKRLESIREETFEARSGLPSFDYFRESVQQKLKGLHDNKSLALIYINIDQFSTIIDRIGHARIEQMVIDIAARLKSILPSHSIMTRVTGDELIILVDQETSFHCATELQIGLSTPFKMNKLEIYVTASMGIATAEGSTDTVDSLIMQAYRAMFEAKQLGGNKIKHYDECSKRTGNELDRNMLERELKKAIENQEFTLYYQPIVQLSSQVIHYEALIRWVSPKLGFISPDQFILVAEECGLIEMIDEWVVDRVCQQIRSIHRDEIRVSVNLSTKTLESNRLEALLLHTTKRHNVDPRHIALEITEHSILKNEVATIDKLKRLREAGFQIAIDDFGVSHASLNYLRLLPANKIKIDKVFIQNVTTGSKDYHIVTSIIALAQKLGMTVTAEGVETEEQVDILQKMNCDEIQGYYFSKPVPIESLAGVTASIRKEMESFVN